MYPSLLLHLTSIAVAALLIYKNVVKSCAFSCYCVVICCDFCCFVWCNFYCFVFVFLVVVVVVFAAMVVGFWPITYVIFVALFVRFGALLYYHMRSFLTCPLRSSENFFFILIFNKVHIIHPRRKSIQHIFSALFCPICPCFLLARVWPSMLVHQKEKLLTCVSNAKEIFFNGCQP